jgi:hypothetical protein
LSGLEWGGFEESAEFGEVAFLVQGDHVKADVAYREKWSRYYFAEVLDDLRFVGYETYLQGLSADKKAIVVSRTRMNQHDFKLIKGCVAPNDWRGTNVNETYSLEMEPLSEPSVQKDWRVKLTKFELLNEFPSNILAVAVPANVPLHDACSGRSQAVAIAEMKEPANSRSWMLYLGIVLFLAGGCVWAFMRKRRGR